MPETPKKQQLTRDQRVQIQTLREIGWTYKQIANHVHVTLRQVQVACIGPRTPQKRRGRPPIITEEQRQDLVAYVTSSARARQMSYLELSTVFEWNVSEYAIKRALRTEGFQRCIALRKPPLSEANKQQRYAFAQAHLNWTREQWNAILWTDETWIMGGRHTRTWVTRRPGEELDPTCVIDKSRARSGWMFWGCFSGIAGKGPSLFWEKEWGTINKDSYTERIVLLIDGWLRMHPGQTLMQDGASGHRAQSTLDKLHRRGVRMMPWPPFSPDLNPIETVWNWMKDYIQTYYDERLGYDRLRQVVQEAWESITEQRLDELLAKMRERCQAVIDAKGGPTRF